MKPRSAKNKGKNFQNEIAKDISNLLNIPWGRDELISSREMGQQGTDIRLLGEAKERFPYSVECKCCEKWNLGEWIEQSRRNCAPGTSWLVVMRKNRFKPVVVMEWETFLKLHTK